MGSSFTVKMAAVFLAGLMAMPAFAAPLKRSEANQIFPEGEYLVRNGRHVRGSPSRRVAAYQHRKTKRGTLVAVTTPKRKSKSVANRAARTKPSKKLSQAKSARPSRYPATQSGARAKKIAKSRHSEKKHVTKRVEKSGKKHATKSRKPDRRSASHAKPRRQERDYPLVSAPRHRVARPDRMIVMDDPAVRSPLPKPARVGAAVRPDQNMLDPEADSAPSEVGEAKAAAMPPVVGPAPASVAEAPPAVEAPSTEAAVAHKAADTASREPDAFDLHSGQDPMRGP